MPQSGQFPDMNYIGPEVARAGPELRYTNYSGQEEIQEQEDGAHPQYANNFYGESPAVVTCDMFCVPGLT